MGSPLRGYSLFALLVFAGWSVVVNARERFAPHRVPATAPAAPHPAPGDRLAWN
jgi:hypothetical protein